MLEMNKILKFPSMFDNIHKIWRMPSFTEEESKNFSLGELLISYFQYAYKWQVLFTTNVIVFAKFIDFMKQTSTDIWRS